MKDQAAFTRLVGALSPWNHQLVYVGGWAHRLYRLHPMAEAPPYQPLATLDADVAFAEGERLEGDIRARLLSMGFEEELMGKHRPPVSQYTLGDAAAGGFYAEFLTPLTGSGRKRSGARIVTAQSAGVTAQRLRYLELLLASPWNVTLQADWGAASPTHLRIPNPVSFIVQKLLIHDLRPTGKKAQDLLYIHDTVELFASESDQLRAVWQNHLRDLLHPSWLRSLRQVKDSVFGRISDRLRDAAAIPQDRDLDPERMRVMCLAVIDDLLD